MNFKSIFNFVVFGLAFVGSSFVAYLFLPTPQIQPLLVKNNYYEIENEPFHISKESYAICELLKRDISNGDNRTESYYDAQTNGKKQAKAVQEYVDISSSMRVSHLPKDFQFAWKKHMEAWRNYSNYLNKNVKHPANFDEDFFSERESELNDKINTTWEDVLDISEKYHPNIRLEID